MRAIVVNQFGGPENLEFTDIPQPALEPGRVLVEVAASGVNFLDVYQRSGALAAPYTAGVEGVGQIIGLGEGIDDLRLGQRVGWFTGGQGSFADVASVQADKAVPIPDGIDYDTALAVLMQGVTAHYLATDTVKITDGVHVLVHAAAGGVGQMLVQVAKIRGASVVGTVSTNEKARLAIAAGADHVALYEDAADTVSDVTAGEGVSVVFDGVGKATFETSLTCLGVRGTLVVFGTASGPTPALELPRLNAGGSLFVTRPSIVHYTRTPDELRRRTTELYAWVERGELKVTIGSRMPIEQVVSAFTALEARRTHGKIVLTH